MYFARERVADRGRALLRANDDVVLDEKVLADRYVKKWCRLLKLGPVVRIFCHADDFHPFVFDLEALTDWFFSRPIFRRHHLIDDRDWRRVLVVSAGKFAAGNNRNSDCSKVSFTDFVVIRCQLLIARWLVAFDLQWRGRVNAIAEWPEPRQGCRLNAWKCPNSLKQLFVKNFCSIGFVAGRKKIYR